MKPISIINKLNESNAFRELAKSNELDVKAMSDEELLSLYSDLMYDVETGQWSSEHNLIPAIEEEIEKRDLDSEIDWENIEVVNEADQSWRHKVMEAKLSNHKDNPVWIVGDVRVGQKSYHVNAKTFMEPSKFGIGEGPTSKLMIQDSKGKTICNYDRGWDIEPEGDNAEICNTILNYIEEWRTRNPYEVNE